MFLRSVIMDKKEYKRLNSLAVNGNAKAFSQLYELVYREMYYTAYYTLSDDADATELVIDVVKEAFSVIGKLRTEEAFVTYMMKGLCTRIRSTLKYYEAEGREIGYSESELRPNDDGIDIRQEFNRLNDKERLVTSLYVAGKYSHAEIARFTGLSAGAVKKHLRSALDGFALD